jgi:hypothetical protein
MIFVSSRRYSTEADDTHLTGMIFVYTVDIFTGDPAESAQFKFALKNIGRISSDLGEFRPFFS